MNETKDYNDATPEERTAALEALGLSLKSTFVPFSQSRHAKPAKGEKVWRSLNWKVTLSRGTRELISTDYSQGEARCPAYEEKDHYYRDKAIVMEIETGKIASILRSIGAIYRTKPIPGPTLLEVCYSLAMDAQSGQESFSDFCSNYGYDEDSRKAEETWRACVDIYKAFGASLTESMGRIVEGY